MGSNLGIALLLGLVGAFAIYDYAIGTNYIFRPLVTGVLVGIVMGDVRQGTIIGASLELMFMGAVSVGAYIPPDIVTGGILGTAFAIGLGKDTGIAMALALPISMIALVVNNLVFMLGTVIATRADKYAAEGNAKGVFRVMNFFGFIRCLNAQCLCCLVQNQLTLRTEYVGRGPDGNADLDILIVCCCCRSLSCC